MTASATRVVVTCSSCEVGLAIATAPMARMRENLGTFFTEHEGCETRIDLSQAPGLRLLPTPATPEHVLA